MVNWYYSLCLRLNNKRGMMGIPFMLVISITLCTMIFIAADFLTVMNKCYMVKSALNRSIKAAVMCIDTDAKRADGTSYFAEGIFLIDEDKSEQVFKEVLAGNLGLDDTTLSPDIISILQETPQLLEYEVINDYLNMPRDYYSPTMHRSYVVENPSVYTVLTFKVKGILLSDNMKIGKLAGAQLLNKQTLTS